MTVSVEDTIHEGETVEARHTTTAGVRWVRTDKRILRESTGGVESLAHDDVEGVVRTPGRRNLSYLIAGLTALTAAVVLPTVMVAVEGPFWQMAPVAGVLALLCPVGLVSWYRSATKMIRIEVTGPAGRHWRLPATPGAEAIVASAGTTQP